MVEKINLNLARKWRSKNFAQIIGQDLSVRILKNSLYKNKFFPVYLFSGQRGCGKTTTARVFSASLNCHSLTDFRKDPKKSSVPCLLCISCRAMAQGNHPDFFEIDAASHTGVDNVRQIIDSSSLLPLMGSKKIYLIDEAHMLSKAAFNALLKILEEPPHSVLFILATTDTEKIIDTVKSRCFQLFFQPVSSKILHTHLKYVCDNEGIRYEDEALITIAKESDGSVRDALNKLEQVRFAASVVTKQEVHSSLGYADDNFFVSLIEYLLLENPEKLLAFLNNERIRSFSMPFVWRKTTTIIRTLIYVKYGIQTGQFVSYHDRLSAIVGSCSWQKLNDLLFHFFTNELLFRRTIAQYEFFEMILLQYIQRNRTHNDNSGTVPVTCSPSISVVSSEEQEASEEESEDEETEGEEDSNTQLLWSSFLDSVKQLNDQLLYSIFTQASVSVSDKNKNELKVSFVKNLNFFKEFLEQTKNRWYPLLVNFFGTSSSLHFDFIKTKDEKIIKKSGNNQLHQVQVNASITPKEENFKSYKKLPQNHSPLFQGKNPKKGGIKKNSIDISDQKKWAHSHMLLEYFPGTIGEIQENTRG